MDEDDTDSVPVRDSNENNNVRRPRKSSAGASKPTAAAAAAANGTKRPSKTPQDNEVGKKKLAPASAYGIAASNNDYPGDAAQLPAVATGGSGKPPPADAGDNTGLIRARQDVSRWDRAVLEDKYLRLLDDEIVLKRHCRKQEERIKKMSVKLIRLAADKRSATTAAARRGGAAAAAAAGAESSVVADTLAELEAQVKKQEKEKQQLEERYNLLREQLQTVTSAAAASHRASQAYDGVPPRIDSGIKRDPRVAKGLRVAGPARPLAGMPDGLTSQRSSLPPPSPQKLPRYGHSLLEDAREQIQYMESIVEQQNEQIRICEEERQMLEEEMERKDRGFEEDLLRIKQEATGATRAGLQENVDLIRLQREVKDKAARILSMQTQYDSLEANMRSLKESHGGLLKQMEGLNAQLLAEQSRSISLQSQLKRNPSDLARIKELEESVTDAKKEIHVLKEANEKLVASAFDMEREREWRKRENALKVQIAQLEATLKADLGEKGSILDRLTAERDATERRDTEFRQLQKEYFKVKEQCEQMQEKANFFSKESAIDFAEIEEALILLKAKKEKDSTDMSFLSKVEEEKSRDLEKQMMVLQADYAETIEELEKTRNLLIVQHQINKDYQLEVEAVTKKMDENRREYDAKLDEYAQLLDIRAARIRKLELQLRDVAYGTKQYKLRAAGSASGADDAHVGVGSDVEEIDETIHLERGENLFEIHIDKLTMTREALAALGDDEPSLFCTWEFFEHEIQATAVVKGPVAVFDFTSQYIVRVDDFFLHHLQKESTVLEVHQAIGTEYRTIAMCRLHFRDIFDKAHGRLHGSVDISFEVADDALQQQPAAVSRLQLGNLSFWVRLRVPMDQALRLYKERTKALGYISSNEAATAQRDASGGAVPFADSNVNELHVRVLRAGNVKARQTDVQPSPYCIYKFFDFPDHDTAIMTSSNSPVFNDLKVFPVVMAADLDSYLKSAALEIFVFDDTDPEVTSYLGMASVPLLALAHDKAIKGTFELKKADGTVNGTLDVLLKWQCTYLPPDAATRIPAQGALARSTQKPRVGGSSLALMRGEQVRTVATSVAPGQRQQQQRNIVMQLDDEVKEDDDEEADDSEERRPRKDVQPAAASRAASATAGAQKVIRPVTSSPKVESGASRKQTDPASSQATKGRSHVVTAAEALPASAAAAAASSRADSYSSIQTESAAVSPSPPAGVRAAGKSKSSAAAAAAAHALGSQPPSGHPTRSARPSAAPRTASAPPPPGVAAPGGEASRAVEEPPPEAIDSDGSMTISSLSTDVTSAAAAVQGLAAKENEELTRSPSAQSGGAGRFNTELTTEVEDDDEDEMAAAVAAANAAANDTSKTFSAEEEEGDEEDTRLDEGTLDGSGEVDLPITGTHDSETIEDNAEPEMHSDSDGVVSPVPRRSLSALPKDSTVTIAVNHLSIEDGSKLLTDPAVQRLFVAYSFLDCSAAELETPVSLPKPDHLNRPLQYNFRRVFRVDAGANSDKRQYLASMLLADAPDQGRIIFTVVSEPQEDDQNSECMDVGTASVSLLEIVKKKQDLIDTNIEVKSVHSSNEVIGALNVTVECLAVLEAIKDEFILT